MRDLAGKRALVTGAAGGIGRELALRLAGEGVDLYLLDINGDQLNRTAEQVRELGVDTVVRRCDVAAPEQITSAVGEALDRWAGVDILVNNAGVTYHGFTHQMPRDEWERLMAINLHAPVQLTQELLPSLLARPRAHVLNVCSILGLVGLPRVSAYATTKFAMVGFSESLRNEYGRWGLGVTALCPGFVKTNLFSAARPEVAGDAPKQPPGWLCTTPERVAKAGVQAIRRNRARVVVEPFARSLFGAKQLLPSALDWCLRLGENRRVAKQEKRLAELSANTTESYRLLMAEQEREQLAHAA